MSEHVAPRPTSPLVDDRGTPREPDGVVPVDWEQALDGIEADLDRVVLALARGDDVPSSAWAAPSDLGELPAELVDRARALLERIAQAALHSRERMAELDEELEGLSTRRRAADAYRAGDPP